MGYCRSGWITIVLLFIVGAAFAEGPSDGESRQSFRSEVQANLSLIEAEVLNSAEQIALIESEIERTKKEGAQGRSRNNLAHLYIAMSGIGGHAPHHAGIDPSPSYGGFYLLVGLVSFRLLQKMRHWAFRPRFHEDIRTLEEIFTLSRLNASNVERLPIADWPQHLDGLINHLRYQRQLIEELALKIENAKKRKIYDVDFISFRLKLFELRHGLLQFQKKVLQYLDSQSAGSLKPWTFEEMAGFSHCRQHLKIFGELLLSRPPSNDLASR